MVGERLENKKGKKEQILTRTIWKAVAACCPHCVTSSLVMDIAHHSIIRV